MSSDENWKWLKEIEEFMPGVGGNELVLRALEYYHFCLTLEKDGYDFSNFSPNEYLKIGDDDDETIDLKVIAETIEEMAEKSANNSWPRKRSY